MVTDPRATDRSNGSFHRLLTFTTYNRFNGPLRLSADRVEVVLGLEGTLAPGVSSMLRETGVSRRRRRASLFDPFAHRIQSPLPLAGQADHSPDRVHGLVLRRGSDRSRRARQPRRVRAGRLDMHYVRIDDDQHRNRADSLVPRARADPGAPLPAFARRFGLEATICVAPFIAEFVPNCSTSIPDWFVQRPLKRSGPSMRISFSARARPGTCSHHASSGTRHLASVFRAPMHERVGTPLLQARHNNVGGAFFHHHDASATSGEERTEGDRGQCTRPMSNGSILLGTNSPMRRLYELFDAMRTTSASTAHRATVVSASLSVSPARRRGRLWIGPNYLLLIDRRSPGPDSADPSFDFHARDRSSPPINTLFVAQ